MWCAEPVEQRRNCCCFPGCPRAPLRTKSGWLLFPGISSWPRRTKTRWWEGSPGSAFPALGKMGKRKETKQNLQGYFVWAGGLCCQNAKSCDGGTGSGALFLHGTTTKKWTLSKVSSLNLSLFLSLSLSLSLWQVAKSKWQMCCEIRSEAALDCKMSFLGLWLRDLPMVIPLGAHREKWRSAVFPFPDLKGSQHHSPSANEVKCKGSVSNGHVGAWKLPSSWAPSYPPPCPWLWCKMVSE